MTHAQLSDRIATFILTDNLTTDQYFQLLKKYGTKTMRELPADKLESFYADVVALSDRNG